MTTKEKSWWFFKTLFFNIDNYL